MEIVFTNNFNKLVRNNTITGLYGDLNDLINLNIQIDGIEYDDEWTVKKLLNGRKLRLNKRINYLFEYLNINIKLLDIKIKNLSKRDLKYVLLAYTLLLNKNNIIFDYYDYGLTYKEKKKIINLIKSLKQSGKTIIVITKDLLFLSKLTKDIIVTKNGKNVYQGDLYDLIEYEQKLIDLPDIVKFINLANNIDKNIVYTLDSNELLKEIYRSVD